MNLKIKNMPIELLKQNLEYLRKSNKMNTTEFSILMGYSTRMYSRIKTDYILPSTESLNRLSVHFKVSIDDMAREDLSKLPIKRIRNKYREIRKYMKL